jgi:hypothetical protein
VLAFGRAFLGAVWVLLAVSCTAVGFLLGVLLVVTGCGAWDRFRCCGASVLLLSVVDQWGFAVCFPAVVLLVCVPAVVGASVLAAAVPASCCAASLCCSSCGGGASVLLLSGWGVSSCVGFLLLSGFGVGFPAVGWRCNFLRLSGVRLLRLCWLPVLAVLRWVLCFGWCFPADAVLLLVRSGAGAVDRLRWWCWLCCAGVRWSAGCRWCFGAAVLLAACCLAVVFPLQERKGKQK